MPDILQFRRAGTDENASFTGAVAELTVDVEKNVLILHDGVTPGGHPLQEISSFSAFKSALATAVAGATNYATLKQAILDSLEDSE